MLRSGFVARARSLFQERLFACLSTGFETVGRIHDRNLE